MNLRTMACAVAALLVLSPLCAQNIVSVHVLGLFHPRVLELRRAGEETLAVGDGRPRFLLNGEPAHQVLELRAAEGRVQAAGFLFDSLRVTARDGSVAELEIAVPARMRRAYRGTLSITARGNELFAVVALEREDAVAAIVAAEMPADAPTEALKAQAVAARSFLAAGPRHEGFDFCDTTHCQFLRSPQAAPVPVRSAVKATRGLVLAWNHRVFSALYSSRCGGRTNSLRDVGMEPGEGYPYFAVECAWCRAHPLHWQAEPVAGAAVPVSGDEAARIRYVRRWGWSALPGNRYSAINDEVGRGAVEGTEIGHGIGMCQHGAIGMAAAGADYRSILAYYYPATSVERLPLQRTSKCGKRLP